MSSTIEQATFDTYKATAVTTPDEQLQLVRNSLKHDTNLAGRELVYDYIVNEVLDPNAQDTALIHLAATTKSGIRATDYSLTNQEKLKQAELEQLTAYVKLHPDSQLHKEIQNRHEQLNEDYTWRIGDQRSEKAAGNQQRLHEFESEIQGLFDPARTHDLTPANALFAYQVVEEMQTYFGQRDDGSREDTNWPAGIPLDEREKIEARLYDYAVRLIDKIEAPEQAALYLHQVDIVKDLTHKNQLLQHATSALSKVPSATKQVTTAIQIAEAAVKVDAEANEAGDAAAANVARDTEHDALNFAIWTVKGMPQTHAVTYNNDSKVSWPISQKHLPYWSTAPSKPATKELANPDFLNGRTAIQKFNAGRVKEMLEADHTASLLANAGSLWLSKELPLYWEPIIHGLFKGVVTDDEKRLQAKKVSAKKLEYLHSNWHRFERVAPPDVVDRAKDEEARLLKNARIVD